MLTKRKRVLVVVLGAGIAALVADRAVGYGPTGPSQAGAAMTPQSVALSESEPYSQSVQTNNTATLVDDSLATRLDNLRAKHCLVPSSARDAFCPSQPWLDELQPRKEEAKHIAVTSSDEVRAQDFSRKHVLKAVVLVDGGGAAIIDDRYVPVGRKIDGFRLMSVDKHVAVLTFNTAQAILRMNMDEGN